MCELMIFCIQIQLVLVDEKILVSLNKRSIEAWGGDNYIHFPNSVGQILNILGFQMF